jgi:excisionase family DNA binding protein
MIKQWLTPKEVRLALPEIEGRQISNATVWRWMKNGTLPYRKLGGRRLIDRADVDALMDGERATSLLQTRRFC